MFLLKKAIAPLFLPLPLCFILLISGIFLLWFTRKQRAGKVLVTSAALLLTLLSYSPVPNRLLEPLEYRYPPLVEERSSLSSSIGWIVVLGGGHVSDPRLPVTSQISASSLVRLIEGVRLYKKHPGSKLLLSGGTGFDPVPNAEIMAGVASAIGVPPEDVILESESKDTEDQARFIKDHVGGTPFILVTSASHMPRSVALFKKQGMNPFPAPIGHLVKERQELHPGTFYPDADGLIKAAKAFHEYLGLLWSSLRGHV